MTTPAITDRVEADSECGICRAVIADGHDPRTAFVNPGFEEHVRLRHRPRIMDQSQGADWVLYNGDSAEVLPGLPDHSVDFSVFSPPFSSTYTYSPSDRDLGNVANDAVFWQQFSFITAELLRLMRPGRLVAVHVANLPAYENTHGYSGRRDFRGDTIRHFEQAGFFYHSEITIDKNPQAQAIRTHSKGLLFVQLTRDAAAMWQAWADYLVVFRAPGKNDKPVASELSQDEWIEYARPVWYGIRETDVLGTHEAREDDDERHLCPLQLPVIERAVRLWSARGETVLSPFAGIGSEGVGALRHGRRFVGIELKPSYFRVAARNLRAAENGSNQDSLFDQEAS
jgi:DNA modification methylase